MSAKPTLIAAAVQVALNHLLDDRPEEAVLLLETAVIFCQEAVEVMEEDAVEDGVFGMTGTIDSWHSKELSIKKWTNLEEIDAFAWKQRPKLKLAKFVAMTGVDNRGGKGNQPLTPEQGTKTGFRGTRLRTEAGSVLNH